MSQRPTLHVTIVTAQQTVFDGEADMVIAPGSEGQLGILPRHAPLLTTLKLGELRIREHGTDEGIFVAGGFLEVNDNVVTILADDAERAEEIDEAHAEEARRRAQATLQQANLTADVEASAAAELERAIGRLKVADLQRRRGRAPRRSVPESLGQDGLGQE
ncbi:MAG TPA: F0F1 ATP synthase subunit epsilon [Ktedonobacterales bacterium]|nr:F0F1 ATP synthase subunit epsilon [Ktedonobacterales bacterium]